MGPGKNSHFQFFWQVWLRFCSGNEPEEGSWKITGCLRGSSSRWVLLELDAVPDSTPLINMFVPPQPWITAYAFHLGGARGPLKPTKTQSKGSEAHRLPPRPYHPNLPPLQSRSVTLWAQTPDLWLWRLFRICWETQLKLSHHYIKPFNAPVIVVKYITVQTCDSHCWQTKPYKTFVLSSFSPTQNYPNSPLSSKVTASAPCRFSYSVDFWNVYVHRTGPLKFVQCARE